MCSRNEDALCTGGAVLDTFFLSFSANNVQFSEYAYFILNWTRNFPTWIILWAPYYIWLAQEYLLGRVAGASHFWHFRLLHSYIINSYSPTLLLIQPYFPTPTPLLLLLYSYSLTATPLLLIPYSCFIGNRILLQISVFHYQRFSSLGYQRACCIIGRISGLFW